MRGGANARGLRFEPRTNSGSCPSRTARRPTPLNGRQHLNGSPDFCRGATVAESVSCYNALMAHRLVLMLVMLVPASLADNDRIESLAGIKGLMVKIEPMSSAMQPYLTDAQIRTDVELRIRKAGIPVVPRLENSSQAYLYVAVTAMPEASFIFGIEVWVQQEATLDRNGKPGLATTWNTGYLGRAPTVDGIRKRLGDQIDDFLNDYLTANPKAK